MSSNPVGMISNCSTSCQSLHLALSKPVYHMKLLLLDFETLQPFTVHFTCSFYLYLEIVRMCPTVDWKGLKLELEEAQKRFLNPF